MSLPQPALLATSRWLPTGMAFLCPRPGVCRAGDRLCSEGQGTRFPPATNPTAPPGCVRLSHTHQHGHHVPLVPSIQSPQREERAALLPPGGRENALQPGPAEPLAGTQLSGALGTVQGRGSEAGAARGRRGWRPYLQVDEDGRHVRGAQQQPQGHHVVLEERARHCRLGLEGLATFQARGAPTASPRWGAPCGPLPRAGTHGAQRSGESIPRRPGPAHCRLGGAGAGPGLSAHQTPTRRPAWSEPQGDTLLGAGLEPAASRAGVPIVI